MAFVNEYISEENMKKYKIGEIHERYYRKRPDDYKYHWTFDEKRECFFLLIRCGYADNPNEMMAILHYRGIDFEVTMSNLPGGSIKFSENPYIIIWGLINMSPQCTSSISNHEIILILKEALIEFKIFGIYTPKTNGDIIIKFNF